ncbi:MAG: aliphatic sulfonate ABC transporter substrate-binding protein [Geminicoccaceae bacterium]
MPIFARRLLLSAAAAAVLLQPWLSAAAAEIDELVVDWAFYNPVSLVLKNQGLIEEEFAKDGIEVRWVQSHGSNKALEFLSADAIQFGSTAGAASLVGRINGNPIKSIYVYSKPEWTALVTTADSPIQKVEDLKGKSVAVTRGTDPHIFLMRALADVGLGEDDVDFVLLQHADGRAALSRGDVDAWAGLDPMMASAELEEGARLFYRNADANSWGILNVREEFAAEHPEIIARVLAVYEQGRKWALEHPDELAALLAEEAGIPVEVAQKQLGERTELTHNRIGDEQRATIREAGLALQKAGVIDASVDVEAVLDELIEPSFGEALAD